MVVSSATDSCSDNIGNGAFSYAQCPQGYSLTGGGHKLTLWAPVDNYRTNSPDASAPSGNGWVVGAGAKSAYSCFQAFAICMK